VGSTDELSEFFPSERDVAGILAMLAALSLTSGVALAEPGRDCLLIAQRERPMVIGHRGAAGLAPENTMAAVDRALALGVDGVEVDVHRSADGELVVIHDRSVQRTTDGHGDVADMSWDQLSQLDAGAWFHPDFAGEPIPRLAAVLDRVAASEALLFIELKSPQRSPGIEEQVIALVAQHGMQDRVHLLSFHKPTLRGLLERDPGVVASGLWRLAFPRDDSPLGVVNAWFGAYRSRPGAIDRAHARGELAWAWVVNRPEQAAWLSARGIDGLTTDFPDRLLVGCPSSQDGVAQAP
jgi:glycerophosphoryl diester phosphodiesterase